MKKGYILKENLKTWLGAIKEKFPLIAPVQDDGLTLFKEVEKVDDIVFDYGITRMPPKDLFFPQTEKMFRIKNKNNVAIELESPEKITDELVLFGVHSCDLKSILALDPVFTTRFPDRYYQERRDKTYVIGLSCTKALPTCFCTAYGINPTDADGADVHLTEVGDKYLVEVVTERGEKLVAAIPGIVFEDTATLEAEKEKLTEKVKGEIKFIDLTGVKEVLDENFELPLWEKWAQKCLGCGICTYVCPTCHCFDINDFNRGDGVGERFRCWDSCMFSDFTRMAGGHNPRPTKKERVRNRFMHKLKYHLDRYDIVGCVGCGRCVQRCPENIDIRAIISDIKGGV